VDNHGKVEDAKFPNTLINHQWEKKKGGRSISCSHSLIIYMHHYYFIFLSLK